MKRRGNGDGCLTFILAVVLASMVLVGLFYTANQMGKPISLDRIELGSILELAPEQNKDGKFSVILVDQKGTEWALKLDEKPPQKGVVTVENGKKKLIPIQSESPKPEKE